MFVVCVVHPNGRARAGQVVLCRLGCAHLVWLCPLHLVVIALENIPFYLISGICTNY